MKLFPMTSSPTLTVQDVIDRLSTYDPTSPVSMILELRSGPDPQDLELQVEDELVDIATAGERVILIARSFD